MSRQCLPYHNSLLMLDSFHAHTTEQIEVKMSKNGITHCVIPGGCTYKLPPLQVCVNKHFKQILKGCWSGFIHTSVSAAANKAGKIKTASKQQSVGHLPRELSCLLWSFMTHGGEIECTVAERWQVVPSGSRGVEIPCSMMPHGKVHSMSKRHYSRKN